MALVCALSPPVTAGRDIRTSSNKNRAGSIEETGQRQSDVVASEGKKGGKVKLNNGLTLNCSGCAFLPLGTNKQ
jgi:hypothetical protein